MAMTLYARRSRCRHCRHGSTRSHLRRLEHFLKKKDSDSISSPQLFPIEAIRIAGGSCSIGDAILRNRSGRFISIMNGCSNKVRPDRLRQRPTGLELDGLQQVLFEQVEAGCDPG